MFDFFIQRRLLSAEMWRSVGGGKNRKEVKKKKLKRRKKGVGRQEEDLEATTAFSKIYIMTF